MRMLIYTLILFFLVAFWGVVTKVTMDKFATPQASYIETESVR